MPQLGDVVQGGQGRRGRRESRPALQPGASLVLEAAILGRGIALAKETLAASDIAEGRLVRPIESRVPVDFAYYLVAPKSKLNLPKVSFFREWILDQVSAG